MPELDPRTDGKWLAGAFEGGLKAIAFREQSKGAAKHSLLTIELSSRDEGFINDVISVFGGNKYPKRAQSWRWMVTGRSAAELVLSAGKSMVFHRQLSEMTERWIDAETAQKVEIARAYNSQPNREALSSTYADLVKDPYFMAGVVDFHGRIYAARNEARVPTVIISTKNNALLDAIENEYGGSSDLYLRKGEQMQFLDIEMLAARDARCWSVSRDYARRFIGFVEPNVLRIPYEGWNSKPEDKRVRRIKQDLDRISELLEGYQGEVREGVRRRMPTQEEIADVLGLSDKTYRARLRKLSEQQDL